MDITYYGRIDHTIIPKKKAIHFMLDDHIKKSVKIEIKNFHKEIKQIVKGIRVDLKNDTESIKKKMIGFQKELKEIQKKLHVLEFPTE